MYIKNSVGHSTEISGILALIWCGQENKPSTTFCIRESSLSNYEEYLSLGLLRFYCHWINTLLRYSLSCNLAFFPRGYPFIVNGSYRSSRWLMVSCYILRLSSSWIILVHHGIECFKYVRVSFFNNLVKEGIQNYS